MEKHYQLLPEYQALHPGKKLFRATGRSNKAGQIEVVAVGVPPRKGFQGQGGEAVFWMSPKILQEVPPPRK